MRTRNIIYSKLKTILDNKYRDSRNRLIILKKTSFYKNLLKYFYFCNNIKEIYFSLENNIYSYKKCKYCEDNTSNVISNTCISRICRNKHVSSKIDYKKRDEKTKINLMNKYNVTNIAQVPKVKEKIKETMISKYGSEYYFGSDRSIKHLKNNNPSITFNNLKNLDKLNEAYILQNFKYKNKLHVEKCLEFYNISITTLNRIKIKLNINIDNYFTDKNTIEDRINNNFNDIFIVNDRQLIKPLEIDLLNNEFKFGIEYNGLLWHSFGNNYPNKMKIDKNKHLNKTNLCEEKGFQLFHIFEDEFLDKNKKEIWFSIIRNKLKQNENKIFARKCLIKEVSIIESNYFLEENHLQGKCDAKIILGLYFNNELVFIMCFKELIDNEFELIRFCSKLNTSVVGGVSKLIKHFETNFSPKSLISYTNMRYSNGHIYEKLGFKFITCTEPNVFYFKLSDIKLELVKFEPNESKQEKELRLINDGYRIIYDCGNKIFKKEIYENK